MISLVLLIACAICTCIHTLTFMWHVSKDLVSFCLQDVCVCLCVPVCECVCVYMYTRICLCMSYIPQVSKNLLLCASQHTIRLQAERAGVRKHLEGLASQGKTLQQLRKCADGEEQVYLRSYAEAHETAAEWLRHTEKARDAAAQLEEDVGKLAATMAAALEERSELARYSSACCSLGACEYMYMCVCMFVSTGECVCVCVNEVDLDTVYIYIYIYIYIFTLILGTCVCARAYMCEN
jgi:hypothetical protein